MESDEQDEDGHISLAEPDCLFCGGPELLEIGEIWLDGHFTLNSCCASLLECVAADMHDDPTWARELLRRLGAEVLTGRRLRRICDGEGNTPMLDFKLTVRPISFRDACRFVSRHHRHCAPPTAWRWGGALYNGFVLVGVVMIGSPVAPAFMHRGIVEVNRLTVRDDTEPMLRKDACSTLYAWSSREAERRGFSRIISYVREDETGTSLLAAGWTRDCAVRGRSWHSQRRHRSNINADVDEVRWSRTLRPKPPARARPSPAEPTQVPNWIRLDDAAQKPPFGILAD